MFSNLPVVDCQNVQILPFSVFIPLKSANPPTKGKVYFSMILNLGRPLDSFWPMGHWQVWHKLRLKKVLLSEACSLVVLGTLRPPCKWVQARLLEDEKPDADTQSDSLQTTASWPSNSIMMRRVETRRASLAWENCPANPENHELNKKLPKTIKFWSKQRVTNRLS